MTPDLTFLPRRADCPVCGGMRLTEAVTVEAFGVPIGSSRCKSCSLVFQNPRLSDAAIRDCYVAANYWNSAYHEYLAGDRIRILNSRRRMDRVVATGGIQSGRLLDIGSATGIFGVAARDAGFSVTCIEPSPEIAEAGRAAYGLDFQIATWEEAQVAFGSQDVVTLWGTDSHFLEPLRSFRKIADCLRPGGIFAMNYQDFDHPIRKVFPRMKTGWNVIFALSDRSFGEIMRRSGLEVIHAGMEWQQVSIGHVLRAVRAQAPDWAERIVLPVPAVSLRTIVARKIGR